MGILDRAQGEFGTVSLFESDSQAQIVANKLKESLRSSAILLASTRQVSAVWGIGGGGGGGSAYCVKEGRGGKGLGYSLRLS